MVCAPTNKAVAVLIKRFLDTFESFPCNVVLLGDEDKLLENENWSRTNDGYPKLRENLLYTFIDNIKEDYLYVRKILDKGTFGLLKKVHQITCRLENRLVQKIQGREEVLLIARKIVNLIEDFSSIRNKRYPIELIHSIDLIVSIIDSWNHDDIWQEVLQAADVIFCTLGSTGGSLLKKIAGAVDDLVVDEAAAATEPEIYIPFQYLPRRLLCVGDPRQLPATITSRFAETMGLRKSLHERLMYDCGYDHIMLETQYRMRPALSQFPSKNFYEGKLINGANVIRSKYRSGVSMMGCSAYTLYQINGIERHVRSGSIENEAEAYAVVKIVDNLRRISCNSRNWYSVNRIRIITFYQAQVLLIKRLLRKRNLGNVLVATVDSSQGCEADFVILSFVRSEGNGGKNTVGFLTDDRRLNVALTRAKYQIIGVGNIQMMANLPDGKAGSVKRLALDAMNRQSVLPFPSDAILNRKRKPPPSECHRDNGTFETISPFTSNKISENHRSEKKVVLMSSGDSSDSDSSSTSSSSNSSDLKNDSRTQTSRDQHYSIDAFASTGTGCKRRSLLDARVNAASTNYLVSKNASSYPTIGTNPITNRCTKTCDEHNLSSFSDNIIGRSDVRNNFILPSASTSIDHLELKREAINTSLDEYETRETKTMDKNDGDETKTSSTVEHATSTAARMNGELVSSNFPADNADGQQELKQTHSSMLSKTETMAVFEDFSF